MPGFEARYLPVSRPYVKRFEYVYSLHVFQKLRLLDLGLAEFEQILGRGEVIQELKDASLQTRELVLLVEWTRPLHLVVAVDFGQQEERLVTVYEPRPSDWDDELKVRKGGS
jgi:hypothetical protein